MGFRNVTVCLNTNGVRTRELIQEFKDDEVRQRKSFSCHRRALTSIPFLSFAKSFCVVWRKARQSWSRTMGMSVLYCVSFESEACSREYTTPPINGKKSLLEIIRTNHRAWYGTYSAARTVTLKKRCHTYDYYYRTYINSRQRV